MEQPGLTTDVNVRGTLNVLLAARDAGAVVVAASSSSVYGDQTEFPLRESMTLAPRSPYAASKLALEVYCAGMYRSYGVPTVALRYFNVYGPGQDPESEYAAVVPRFAMACLTGARPEVHGDGEQSRDFSYIDDVVEANLRSAKAPPEAYGMAFNIGGGGEPTSVNRLLALIADRVGVTPDPVHTESRAGDVRMTQADVSLAGRMLGYVPQVSIEDGVARTTDWFKAGAGSAPIEEVRTMKVAVVGIGHVGLITGAALASLGHEVVGMDTDPAKVETLQAGRAPFHEPGLDDLLRDGVRSGGLRFTGSIPDAVTGASVVFVCVGRPPVGLGDRSLIAVEGAVREIARAASDGVVLVVKSTVPPGTSGRIDQVARMERPELDLDRCLEPRVPA